jgi:hypothetical protein
MLVASVVLAGTLRGQARPVPDSLLQRLVGTWEMNGTVRGTPVTYRLEGRRVLQNRFVELHMEDISTPPGYEARVFIGADSTGRIIAHWMDVFGAAFSIPPGSGAVRADTLEILFQYADGPFRDRFVYNRRDDSWHFRLESGDGSGGWKLFGEYQVRRK